MEPVLIQTQRFSDERGYFSEVWSSRKFKNLFKNINFLQDNRSVSIRAGTLRGLHFQMPPFDQAKLVTCLNGEIFDVAVDIRKGSPTFAKCFSANLTSENGNQFFIPSGFLHGFVSLMPNTEVFYKCSNHYESVHERAVRFDDPELNIPWPDHIREFVISNKDNEAPLLKDIDNPFTYEEFTDV